MDNGKLNGVVFIDIKKAFDSINHHILLNKMNEQFGIFGVELKWFESYLTNREQQCNVNGELSGNKIITCGVPQGSTGCIKKVDPFKFKLSITYCIILNSLTDA